MFNEDPSPREGAELRQSRVACIVAIALLAATASTLPAQLRKLRVVSTDSVPIVYAYVTVEGGTGQITDEKGEVNLGAGKRKTVTVNVRRIGYQPWFGKLELPDTASVQTVTLTHVALTLGEIVVTGRASISPFLQPFYDRWLMRQQGVLSATFIGPEEIEFRHPDRITNMLSGLNGVSFRRTTQNDLVAFGYNGTCQMAIVVDGTRQCPGSGCKCNACAGNMPEIGGNAVRPAPLSDLTAVPIDRVLDANDVVGIEVYTRGGNMPVSLQVDDPGCGVIAFWTGSRKP
jgi:hypothetical protein